MLTVNHMVEILLQAGRAASGDDDDGGEGLGNQPDPFLCAVEPAMAQLPPARRGNASRGLT